MTNTAQYSPDVENMTINSWDRERTPAELKSFRERLIAKIGELDPTEYAVTA